MNIDTVILATSEGGNFHLLLGDFLDEFYRANQATQQRMLDSSPLGIEGIPNRYLAYAAATAHKLANDFGIDVPNWVFDSRCYLKDAPYFAGGVEGKLRLLFMYFSPAEFKHRNLFVDANVLTRV
jgi:hypothetical protein